MMKLEPIDRQGGLSTAIALLCEGFPDRTDNFWREGLRRATVQSDASGVPPGQILVSKGVPSGVILTFGSLRPGRGEPIINLSAWYVRDSCRFLAPAMLKAISAGPATFTDLTPTPQVARLSQSLGFRPLSQNTAIVPLPVAALRVGAGVLRPWRDLALADWRREMAEAHETFGCVVLGVALPGSDSVIVARPTRYFRFPSFEIVYSDLAVLRDAIGPVSRQLLARGAVTLTVDCFDKADAPAGSLFRRSRSLRLIKGEGFGPEVDHAWSELPLLNP